MSGRVIRNNEGQTIIISPLSEVYSFKIKNGLFAGAGLQTCARPLLVVCRNLNRITMEKLKSAII
jgi:lipid-binding SYLF domain-containing protein